MTNEIGSILQKKWIPFWVILVSWLLA